MCNYAEGKTSKLKMANVHKEAKKFQYGQCDLKESNTMQSLKM